MIATAGRMRRTALSLVVVLTSIVSVAHAAPEPTGPHPRILLDNEVRRAWLGLSPVQETEVAPFATQERMFEQLRDALEQVRYLNGVRGEALMHALRHLIARARPSAMEVNLLIGLARQLRWVARHADLPPEEGELQPNPPPD